MKMRIDQSRLRLSPTPIERVFKRSATSQVHRPVGICRFGSHIATTMTKFFIVKTHSSYNAIIG